MNDDKLREEFESDLSLSARVKNSKNKYANSTYEQQWQGFKRGRQKADEEFLKWSVSEENIQLKKDLKWALNSLEFANELMDEEDFSEMDEFIKTNREKYKL